MQLTHILSAHRSRRLSHSSQSPAPRLPTGPNRRGDATTARRVEDRVLEPTLKVFIVGVTSTLVIGQRAPESQRSHDSEPRPAERQHPSCPQRRGPEVWNSNLQDRLLASVARLAVRQLPLIK